MEHDAFQREVQRHLDAGALSEAATLAVERLGPEVLGFMWSLTRDPDLASESFSVFCEDLWRGLPSFRGEASFRTWAYTLARHAALRVQRDPYRQRRVGIDDHPVLSDLIARVRTSTLEFLKSEVREAVGRLRERLKPDEQTLLVLRVDRKMSFQDIAVVMSGGPLTEGERKKRAALLRKRFERVKAKLQALVEAEGLRRAGEA
ncbi:MAG: sigma-70 family RNA polymerase sigma factor [Myxococcota bacterium]